MKWVLMHGTPRAGFELVGPFETEGQANYYALLQFATDLYQVDIWAMPVSSPDPDKYAFMLEHGSDL